MAISPISGLLSGQRLLTNSVRYCTYYISDQSVGMKIALMITILLNKEEYPPVKPQKP